MSVGFIGIGHMGEPMALNLLRAGIALRVWNRSPHRCAALIEAGAIQVDTLDALFSQSSIVLLMLRGEQAIDTVLARHTPHFRTLVAGRCLVLLGTTSAQWSQTLERDVLACAGRYVEAPVSGSRVPAQRGALVGMLAGAASAIEEILPLLGPLCGRVFRCGEVPNALRMKLAVNHFLIAMVTALAETMHAAAAAGVDLNVLRQVLDAGPMASEVSRSKLAKLLEDDFSAQASIADVAHLADLVLEQATDAGAHAPLMACIAQLFGCADQRGHGALDMAAVRYAFDTVAAARAGAVCAADPSTSI